AKCDLAGAVFGRRPADGTGPRRRDLALATGASFLDDAHDLGDDIAGAPYDDRVSDPDAEPRDLVHVVQRRALHRRPSDEHRREPGDGCQRAHPSDVELHVLDLRLRLLGREFVRDRPPRRARYEAEPLLLIDAIELD